MKYNIIFSSQYFFAKRKYTNTAVHKSIQNIQNSFDGKVAGIFDYISNAVNLADHNKLF